MGPCDFNPRIPYGMRLQDAVKAKLDSLFQSTHPVWDATLTVLPLLEHVLFQSTHPVWDAT